MRDPAVLASIEGPRQPQKTSSALPDTIEGIKAAIAAHEDAIKELKAKAGEIALR